MPGIRKSSKRKQGKTVPVLGAAGLSLSMVGSAAAHVGAGTADLPAQKIAPNHEITLGEEEMSDVSLATFYVFDKESMQGSRGVKVAAGCGRCGGCGGCGRGCGRGCGGGWRGCAGCRGCGCGGGCGGGWWGWGYGGCCMSWGGCRYC
jgi:hypothetical protein